MPVADTETLPPRTATLAGAFSALLGGALAMAVSPIFVRLADVGPYTSAFWRVCLALPILWGWMRLEERRSAPGRSFSTGTIAAGLCFAGDLFFWHSSVMKTTVANATFFATTAPIWVVIFGWLLWREKVDRAVLGGLALCLLGGMALVVQSLQVGTGRATGDAFGIVTAIFFGLYFLAAKAARRDAGAARVTFQLTLITTAILFVVALLLEHGFWPQSVRGWGALCGMAWISHAGGQGLLSIALGRLPPVFSSLVIFVDSIAAAGLAWLILGEPVTPVQGIGGLVIVLGIGIARPRSASP